MSLTTATPRAPDLSGRALDGRYELGALIGEGSFGRVYRGHDRRLARRVAVKVIKPWWTEDPEWVRRFERETQMMARVSAPGIVQIFDVGHSEEGLYYVAELVEGESLQQRLQRGRLGPPEASDIAEQLCRALGRAHAKRVVHGDVKPANILISPQGTVKVGDFGVARLAEGSSAGAAATIMGTPRYMAPEQARGRGTTAATDVYSVGVVLYEMLAGRPPFAGSAPVELALSHLQDAPPPLGRSTPHELARVVDRALAKDPGKRYADGAKMADALKKAGTSAGPVKTPAARTAVTSNRDDRIAATRVAPRLTPRRNANPSARRRRIALLSAVIAVVLGMIGAAIVIGGVHHVRVPSLRGLSKGSVERRVLPLGLHAKFGHRYSATVQKGLAIGQDPAPRAQIRQGATVAVTLSEGPRPVPVPPLQGASAADARAALARAHLKANVTLVPAFGAVPGTVTHESPQAGKKLLPNSTVTLSVAEVPRWRALTTFTNGQSVPFRIRGNRWRLVYRMGYQGNCTFVFICSGPSAHATDLTKGTSAGSFDLNDGSGQIWTFQTGPGLYQLKISPGSDSARWSVQVQDYY